MKIKCTAHVNGVKISGFIDTELNTIEEFVSDFYSRLDQEIIVFSTGEVVTAVPIAAFKESIIKFVELK